MLAKLFQHRDVVYESGIDPPEESPVKPHTRPSQGLISLDSEPSKQAEAERLETEPQREECQQDTRTWAEIPLIEMLPAEYRAQAQEILAKYPNKARILEMCKLGVFDCWTAMDKMGIENDCTGT